MIKTEIPVSEYTDEVVSKGGMYYKYECPKYTDHQTVIVYEFSFTTNPSLEDIASAKEDALEQLKPVVINSLTEFDSSSAVNGFFINEREVWVDRTIRASQMTAIMSAEILGLPNITLVFQDVTYLMTIQEAKLLLATVESYALEVNNITTEHKNAIQELTTLEALVAYDYTQGYPEKPSFSRTEVA